MDILKTKCHTSITQLKTHRRRQTEKSFTEEEGRQVSDAGDRLENFKFGTREATGNGTMDAGVGSKHWRKAYALKTKSVRRAVLS